LFHEQLTAMQNLGMWQTSYSHSMTCKYFFALSHPYQNHKCLRNANYAARPRPCQALMALTSNSGISCCSWLVSQCSINSLLLKTEKCKQLLVSVDLFVKQCSLVSLNSCPKWQMFEQPNTVNIFDLPKHASNKMFSGIFKLNTDKSFSIRISIISLLLNDFCQIYWYLITVDKTIKTWVYTHNKIL